MARGDEARLILVVGIFAIYLFAFALFAGIASLAKINWRVAGGIGIVTAMGLVMLNLPGESLPDAFPWLLMPALGLLAVVGFTALWGIKF
jgi:hypothetical protein